jgi:hypothetical protein
VNVELTGPVRETPKRIVLHLPAARALLNSLSGVSLASRPNQKQRWDFPTVVEKYRASLGVAEGL